MPAQIFALLTLALTSPTVYPWTGLRFVDLTEKQYLRVTGMAKGDRTAIARAITDQLRADMSGSINPIESQKQLKAVVLDTRIMMVDLDGDGSPEMIPQGTGLDTCSPTGNCLFWVFKKSERGYKLLLDFEGVQRFLVARSRTHGFLDIVVAQHGSATESTLRVFHYARGQYHPVACYDQAWQVLEGDEVHNLKEPRVTPCGQGQ